MAKTAPTKTNFAAEPTIIIDPSLYVPEQQRWLLETVCETFIDVTRVLGVLTFAGSMSFGLSQAVLRVVEFERTQTASVALAQAEAAAPREVAMDLGLPAPVAVSLNATCSEHVASAAVGVCSESAPAAPAGAAHALKLARPVTDLAASVRAARRLLALNRLGEAEAAYRKVLVVDEHQPAALLGLARVHLARGQLDEALVFAERAVQVAPDQPGAHLTLGDVLRARGARAPADAQYELSMRLNVKPVEGRDSAPELAEGRGPAPELTAQAAESKPL